MDQHNAHFPFRQKFWKFRLEVRWNWPFVFGPTVIFGTTFAGAHFDWSYRSNRNVPFPFFSKMFSQYRSSVSCLQVLEPNAQWLWYTGHVESSSCLSIRASFCIVWLLIPCFNVLIWWQFPRFILFLMSLQSSFNPCFYHGIWGSLVVRSPLHNMT